MSDRPFSAIPTTEPPAAPPAHRPAVKIWASISTVISIALLIATLFTLWTPANLFSNQLLDQMFLSWQMNAAASAPQPAVPQETSAVVQPTMRIGLVAGHSGPENDPGAVCPDGLTEREVNQAIATLVYQQLVALGYQVDIFNEFDEGLMQYKATVLVSIHNDSCDFVGADAKGFKVAAAMNSVFRDRADRLTACLISRYNQATNLPFHYNTITDDMTFYHNFDEIHTETTAAIIETGFLNGDRDILVNHTDLVARGVADGILCFIRNENPNLPTLTPPPAAVTPTP